MACGQGGQGCQGLAQLALAPPISTGSVICSKDIRNADYWLAAFSHFWNIRSWRTHIRVWTPHEAASRLAADVSKTSATAAFSRGHELASHKEAHQHPHQHSVPRLLFSILSNVDSTYSRVPRHGQPRVSHVAGQLSDRG